MDDYGMSIVFTDIKGRQIEITIEDDWPPKVIARHNGNAIGHLEFIDWDGVPLLDAADVKTEYQKAGIGSQMLKELVEISDEIFVPNQAWSSSTGHSTYLSSEGSALISSCLRKQIIFERHVAEY